MTQAKFREFRDLYIEELRDILVAEVLMLGLKQGGKELDPSFFGPEEREAFKKADEKEWSEWIKKQVIRIVPPEEAAKVPRN